MEGELENQAEQEASGQKARTPPYISYRTFQTLLSELKTNGMPPRIDRSVLARFAGGLQGQILLALRSLGLVDSANQPNAELVSLVSAFDTPSYSGEMRRILGRVYPYVFNIDLLTATPTMFAEAFKQNNDAKEDVLRKCRTFFLYAAKDVGVPIGPRIENGSVPRSRATGVRKARALKNKPDNTAHVKNPPVEEQREQNEVVERLLQKFPEFDPSWPDEIKAKWFEGFERFMDGAGVTKKP